MESPSEKKDIAKELDEWKRPISVADYLRFGKDNGLSTCKSLMLASNQIGSTKETTRRFLVDLSGSPRTLVDRWLSPKDVPTLLEHLRQDFQVIEGQSDAMFATTWTYLWPKAGHPFALWTKDGIVAQRTGDEILLLPHGKDEVQNVEKETTVKVSDVKSVMSWVSECWCFREVRLRLKDESHFAVAKELDCMPSVDFTYGWDQLICDSAWTVELGSALARDIKVPFEDNI